MPESDDTIIVYEFKIEGMTCVNCSSAIENGIKNAFKDKGLVEVGVVLLMHKMRVQFYKQQFEIHKISADQISSEVEDLGFEAELTNTFEVEAAASSRHQSEGGGTPR